MRIALDSIIFGLQQVGGITTYWSELLRGMACRSDVMTTMIAPRTVTAALSGGEGHANLPTAVRERLPSCVSRYLPAPTVPGCGIQHSSYYRVPRDRRVKSVVTVYDFIYERYGRGMARWVHHAQKHRAVDRADAIICISDRTREELGHWYPGARGKGVFVVPLGVNHERWYPETRGLRQTRSGDYVLFVGRRDHYKRFDLAVAAVERSPELQLGVVGPVLTRDEHSMLHARLGSRAWHLGHVDDSKLRELYSSAHAVVIPSECEGFGLPVLEAMACGCPVVANHESGLFETGGSAALWVRAQHPDAYADALGLLSRRETRTAAVAAGLVRAATFGWGDVIERTVSVYRDVA